MSFHIRTGNDSRNLKWAKIFRPRNLGKTQRDQPNSRVRGEGTPLNRGVCFRSKGKVHRITQSSLRFHSTLLFYAKQFWTSDFSRNLLVRWLHDRLLLILSSASMASKWVKTEIAKARQREEKSKRRVLFPVRLVSFEDLRDREYFDAGIGDDSAREIREYFIPDFSNWKDHDQYQKTFDRLLRDLKAETERAAAQS